MSCFVGNENPKVGGGGKRKKSTKNEMLSGAKRKGEGFSFFLSASSTFSLLLSWFLTLI